MIIKESQSLEQIMPAVYNKLKSLGEISNVVPLDKIIKGLQTGSARAFVSNKDRNQDGIPDNINIVYPTIDIDLSQSLSGVTSADVTAFPNVDSQKAYHVLNVLAATLEVLQHEQDHLSGFKSTESESGISEEFGSESSAHQAGHTAAQNFLNKWKNTIDSTINKGSSRKTIHINFEGDYEMRKELVKLANHLDRLGHRDLSDRIDGVIKNNTGNNTEKVSVAQSADWGRVLTKPGQVSRPGFAVFDDSEQKRNSQGRPLVKVVESLNTSRLPDAWNGKYFSDTSAPSTWIQYSAAIAALESDARQAQGSGSSQVASGQVSDAPAEADDAQLSAAHDQLSTEASDSSLDGIFSVNPIGLVSR